MGRRAKTINNYFCEAETAQSNEPAESSLAQTIGGDYATVKGGKVNKATRNEARLCLEHILTMRLDRARGIENR